MKIGIYFNKNYLSQNLTLIERIKKSLSKSSISSKVVEGASDLDDIDALIVLGGDGTILNIASDCAIRGIKIMGINYGHLGFLTEFEPSKIDAAIDYICKSDFSLIKRSMLNVCYNEKNYFALNDIVIQRSTSGNNFSNIIRLRAEIDGVTVDNYSCDGLIVSTPTGSTAYSLSAGGSVLTPDLNAFAITPICAHSLHSRPVVYSDKSVLKIYPQENNTKLNVVVDGKIVDLVGNDVIIVIKKSDFAAEFISLDDKNFFEKLFIKLNMWSN